VKAYVEDMRNYTAIAFEGLDGLLADIQNSQASGSQQWVDSANDHIALIHSAYRELQDLSVPAPMQEIHATALNGARACARGADTFVDFTNSGSSSHFDHFLALADTCLDDMTKANEQAEAYIESAQGSPTPSEPAQPPATVVPTSPPPQPTEAPASAPTAPPPPPTEASSITCHGYVACGNFSSCAEAEAYNNACGFWDRADGDDDGVICEDLCPGG
jgi:hypothetical protein